jgi:hypothetical protein
VIDACASPLCEINPDPLDRVKALAPQARPFTNLASSAQRRGSSKNLI